MLSPIMGNDTNTRTTAVSRALAAALWMVLAAVAALPAPARAQGAIHEVKFGILAHDVPHLWSGFQREATWASLNAEALFTPSIPLLFGTIRPAVGASLNTNGDTSQFYLDARWEIEGPGGLFLGIGLGAALHNGETDPISSERKALGSRILFHVPIEIGLRLDAHNSISLYFEHFSNGEWAKYNEGMDNLGIRYGRRF